MSHVSRFDCLGGRQSGGCGNGVHHVPASLRLFGPCRHWGTPGTRPLPGWFGSVGSTATHAGRGSRWANCCLKGHQREVGTVVDRRGDARANRRAEDRRPHAKRLEKRFAVGPSSELVPSKRTFPIGSHLSGGWATNHHKRLTRFLPWTRSEGSCVATSVNPASHAQDAPRETFLAPVGDFDGRSARLCGRTRLLLVGSGVAGRRAAYHGLRAGHRHRVGRRVTFRGTDLDRVASMDRARDDARVSAAGHLGGRPTRSILLGADTRAVCHGRRPLRTPIGTLLSGDDPTRGRRPDNQLLGGSSGPADHGSPFRRSGELPRSHARSVWGEEPSAFWQLSVAPAGLGPGLQHRLRNDRPRTDPRLGSRRLPWHSRLVQRGAGLVA